MHNISVKKSHESSKVFRTIISILPYLILVFIGILIIIPFLWMIVITLDRTANLIPPFPAKLIPDNVSLFNIKLAFENGYMVRAYMNSFIVTVFGVALAVTSSQMAGYAFSKGVFRGRKFLFMLVLSTMMIPLETRLIPMYKMVIFADLRNSFIPIILPNMLYGFGVLLFRQYFDKIPNSLREAAYIDGSGEFSTFIRVFLPLTGPITATMVILSFMGNWNNFLWPMIVISTEAKRTIPIFLANFRLVNETTCQYGVTMALTSLAVVPVIIVFLFLQKYIVRSIALSGLKE